MALTAKDKTLNFTSLWHKNSCISFSYTIASHMKIVCRWGKEYRKQGIKRKTCIMVHIRQRHRWDGKYSWHVQPYEMVCKTESNCWKCLVSNLSLSIFLSLPLASFILYNENLMVFSSHRICAGSHTVLVILSTMLNKSPRQPKTNQCIRCAEKWKTNKKQQRRRRRRCIDPRERNEPNF